MSTPNPGGQGRFGVWKPRGAWSWEASGSLIAVELGFVSWLIPCAQPLGQRDLLVAKPSPSRCSGQEEGERWEESLVSPATCFRSLAPGEGSSAPLKGQAREVTPV